MCTVDFIIELFCRVDNRLSNLPKHPQANLYPSEVVTLALLRSIKGVSDRAFYRWLSRDYLALFPHLPERSRLMRLFAAHQEWSEQLMAEPTILGVADSYGIELLHPRREGRSEEQIGKKGLSNQRWIVGAKCCYILNQWGRIVAWESASANVSDTKLTEMIRRFEGQMVVMTDPGFHAKADDPTNLKVCKRGTWNVRMVIETMWSMLTTVCHTKKMLARKWPYLKARLAFTAAAFNVLVDWNGVVADEHGKVHLSIAEFGL
jgi:hypothetical protein